MIRIVLVFTLSLMIGHTVIKAMNNHIDFQLESMNHDA